MVMLVQPPSAFFKKVFLQFALIVAITGDK